MSAAPRPTLAEFVSMLQDVRVDEPGGWERARALHERLFDTRPLAGAITLQQLNREPLEGMLLLDLQEESHG